MIISHVPNYNAVFPSVSVQRTGPHDVGTLRTRLRIAGSGDRSLTVQLWYPAEGAPTVVSRLRSWYMRLRHPNWAPARHRAQLRSAQSQFPLITYVPDAPGGRQDNTYTLANLASHGFILAAIENPFVASWGEHALFRSDPAPSFDDPRVRSGVLAASELLDALEALKPNSPVGAWAGRLDLKRAGILGYALGGNVAVASSAIDGRYTVAGCLDRASAEGPLVKVPYLHMRSDPAASDASQDSSSGHRVEPQANGPARTQASLPTSHIIEVRGTRREHFSDQLIISLRFARSQRRVVSLRVRAIIDAYTVAFFQTYLQASPHPLMCVRHSPYPEVRFVEGNGSDIAFHMDTTEHPRSEPH